MNILLLNDTGTVPHVGCQAVSDAHARMLGESGHSVIDRAFLGELRHFALGDPTKAIEAVLADDRMRARIEACDAVVVNGEGTIHHGAGTEYFAVLGAAQRLRKASLLVNAVFEAHEGWHDVLSKLDDLCVRDALSLEHVRSHGLRGRLVPDSFLGASFSDRFFIDLDDRIVVTDWHPARDSDVGSTMKELLNRVDSTFYFPLMHGVHACMWRDSAATWATSSLVVTARHHGIYLAALARKPFIALPSNTHKIEGLLNAAQAKIPVCSTTEQVESALAYAMDHLGEYERLFDWLASHVPLTTFSALGRSPGGSCASKELERLEQQKATRGLSRDPRYWGFGNGQGHGLTSTG